MLDFISNLDAYYVILFLIGVFCFGLYFYVWLWSKVKEK